MLPTSLLPANALAFMRDIANQFMQEPITLYSIAITYDMYGQQTVTSGVTWSGLGYVGFVGKSSYRDREMLNQLNQYWGGRDGIEYKYVATILLPFETAVSENYIARINQKDYQIIWVGNDTMNGVQVYTKCYARLKFYGDIKDV